MWRQGAASRASVAVVAAPPFIVAASPAPAPAPAPLSAAAGADPEPLEASAPSGAACRYIGCSSVRDTWHKCRVQPHATHRGGSGGHCCAVNHRHDALQVRQHVTRRRLQTWCEVAVAADVAQAQVRGVGVSRQRPPQRTAAAAPAATSSASNTMSPPSAQIKQHGTTPSPRQMVARHACADPRRAPPSHRRPRPRQGAAPRSRSWRRTAATLRETRCGVGCAARGVGCATVQTRCG